MSKTILGFTPVKWDGQGPIKVLGGITNRAYRFDGNGSVTPVDNRDLAAIRSIPNMKVVSS